MAVNLSKGGRVNLEKESPGLQLVLLGLGWDVKKTDGADFDLDASVLMLDAEGKAIGDGGFIFYNNKSSECGSVNHQGDNRSGEGAGDDEVITVDLLKVPANVDKLMIAVTIHEAATRKQNFGQVDNAFIRLADNNSNEDIARYDLTEDYSAETLLIFGEMYRKDGEWRFAAKGDGFVGGLSSYLAAFGIAS